MTTATITHAELVSMTARWLRSQFPGQIIICEYGTRGHGERPDILRFARHDETYVYECKVSRSDSIADAHKRHRRLFRACGNYRYIVSPPGVQVVVPDNYGHIIIADYGRGTLIEVPHMFRGDEVGRVREWELLERAWSNMERASCGTAEDAKPGKSRKLSTLQHEAVLRVLRSFGARASVKEIANVLDRPMSQSKQQLRNAILYDLQEGLIPGVRAVCDGGVTYAELID